MLLPSTRPSPPLTLRPLARADFALLAGWLAQPHVARWWNHETHPTAIERDFGPSIDGEDQAEIFIASLASDSQNEWPREGWPIGLVQRYTFADNPGYMDELAPLLVVPGEALSMDYFIGEPDALHRGLGSEMLRVALQSTWPACPHAPAVIVPVVVVNTASWRMLERVGFHRVANGPLTPDNPIDDPEHYVYRFDRPGEVGIV